MLSEGNFPAPLLGSPKKIWNLELSECNFPTCWEHFKALVKALFRKGFILIKSHFCVLIFHSPNLFCNLVTFSSAKILRTLKYLFWKTCLPNIYTSLTNIVCVLRFGLPLKMCCLDCFSCFGGLWEWKCAYCSMLAKVESHKFFSDYFGTIEKLIWSPLKNFLYLICQKIFAIPDLLWQIIQYDSTQSCNHPILNGFRNIFCTSGCTFQVMLQCLVAAVDSKF